MSCIKSAPTLAPSTSTPSTTTSGMLEFEGLSLSLGLSSTTYQTVVVGKLKCENVGNVLYYWIYQLPGTRWVSLTLNLIVDLLKYIVLFYIDYKIYSLYIISIIATQNTYFGMLQFESSLTKNCIARR